MSSIVNERGILIPREANVYLEIAVSINIYGENRQRDCGNPNLELSHQIRQSNLGGVASYSLGYLPVHDFWKSEPAKTLAMGPSEFDL